MRAVIYARYSSDNQREASIEDQIRICRAHIEQQSWEYLTAYTDHAISGASTLRPGYQKLLEDARGHQFERSSSPKASTASHVIRNTWRGCSSS